MEKVIEMLTEMSAKSEQNKTAIEQKFAENTESVKGEIKVIKDEFDTIKSELTEVKKSAGQIRLNPASAQEKSFNDILGETLDANKERIMNHKKGQGEMNFRYKGFEEAMEVKAVGDMSIAANFPGTGSAQLRTDVRSNIIAKPYERTWLADVLPSGSSSTGNNVLYPKENGGEGGAAPWTNPAVDKAQMDFDLTSYNAYFKWLAGWVIVEREMLDDFAFMTSYIQQKMLLSLKIAENDLILNGTADTNPVVGLIAAATAYSGTYTKAVEKIVDAGWGQIVEDTQEFYSPTHTILRPRDSVKIGLNTATGSGEYDLPNGSVAFANGKLQIGGMDTVSTTSITVDKFLTLDARATMFIRRIQPELRLFEDSALAKKNKLMFRVEERATLAIFNNAAIVYGDLGYVA